jgi:hypothetical protein
MGGIAGFEQDAAVEFQPGRFSIDETLGRMEQDLAVEPFLVREMLFGRPHFTRLGHVFTSAYFGLSV